MCNIVTEFYLYSIVYIYLINSRLDVTFSVRHHFRTIQTLSDLWPLTHTVVRPVTQATSACWRFLPYDLITVQNWCHLHLILHYSTQFMCTEAFCIDMQ